MLKKILSNVGEYKTNAILSPILVSLEVLLEVMIPFTMALLIDNGVEKGDLSYTIKIGAVLLGMSFLALVFGALSGRECAVAGVGFAKNMRRNMFSNIQNFSFSNIDKFSTSSLITRMTTDVTNVQNAFQTSIRVMVRAPLMLICSTIFAAKINGKLAGIFLCLLPFLAVFLIIIISKAFPIFKRMFKKYDALNLTTQENLTNIRTVKSYVREGYEIKKMDDASQEVFDVALRAEKIVVLGMPMFMLMIYAAMISISWLGGNQIISGTMSKGGFMSFIGYVMQIFISFVMVGMNAGQIIMSRAAAERIVDVLSEESDIKNVENAITSMSDSTIEFTNVNFSYTGDESNTVLSDINLTVKPGETLGILGGTGSGKSSLVQLIPRLYDVTSGKITIGGIDVKDYDIKTLRDNISMVLQKNMLFSGTIEDNLKWGDEDADLGQVEQAAAQAAAKSFIDGFEGGFATELGQGGSNVSGGQKQRLCIARALLKKPKILIFDDSTSAVDVKTNADIMKAINNDFPNTTKIIIAQRLISLKDADRILIINDGKIVAVGSHEELYDHNEIYTEVYNEQMKGAIE